MPKDTKTLCIKKGCASVLTQPHELRDNLDRLPKVIYFTDSFLALHIDRKGNAFYCIML